MSKKNISTTPKARILEFVSTGLNVGLFILETILIKVLSLIKTLYLLAPFFIGISSGFAMTVIIFKTLYFPNITYSSLLINVIDHVITYFDGLTGYVPPEPNSLVKVGSLTLVGLKKVAMWTSLIGGISLLGIYAFAFTLAMNKIFLVYALPFCPHVASQVFEASTKVSTSILYAQYDPQFFMKWI